MTHHEVTKDMTIAEVLRNNPKTAPVFMRNGMQCLGCASSTGETIAQAAVVHGIDADNLIKELNNA